MVWNSPRAIIELKTDTAIILKQRFSAKLPHIPAFKLPVLTSISKMFKADMEHARTQWLDDAEKNLAEHKAREKSEYLTTEDKGRGKADFHSLRHTFGSLLAASGVHPKTAQELMRHSDINLTMSRYSHTFRRQTSKVIQALPDFTAMIAEQARAIGTDDNALTHQLAYPTDF